MDIAKLFRSKIEEDEQHYAKAQKNESSKKSTQKTAKSKKSESGKKVSKKADESRMNWWFQTRQYFREVVYELRKVVWPSRKETIGSTAVVLVIVIISGIFLGVVDFILSRLIRLLIG